MTTGDVELTIVDGGGAVVVPSASVELMIGCSSAGVAGQLVATRNINTLISNFGYGPLVESCAMKIARGGTVIACKAPSNTPGAQTAVIATALGGTSIITVTGTAFDTYFVKVKVVKSGTIGTAGCQIQISLDAGRSYGPVIALNALTTFPIAQTGLTLAFAAGTLVVGATYTFGATEPLWNVAGLQTALSAFQTSQYGMVGVGGTEIVGPMSGSDAATVNGYLETMAAGKVFTRAVTSARDASPPTAYGGTAETEAAWTTVLVTASSALDAKRIVQTAGHYNQPSQIPNPHAGSPRYRRPGSWALVARQIGIPPQRHAGRVRDGALLDIVFDPTVDPNDGFVYHDERINPGLKAARYATFRTRIKKTGFYADDPLLMSAIGSVFTMLPLGTVMDIACGIVTDVGQNEINEDIRLNKNGTIFENEAQTLETSFNRAIDDNMFAKNMISDFSTAVDRTNNIRATSIVNVAVKIYARGYVLEADVTIGFGSATDTPQ